MFCHLDTFWFIAYKISLVWMCVNMKINKQTWCLSISYIRVSILSYPSILKSIIFFPDWMIQYYLVFWTSLKLKNEKHTTTSKKTCQNWSFLSGPKVMEPETDCGSRRQASSPAPALPRSGGGGRGDHTDIDKSREYFI